MRRILFIVISVAILAGCNDYLLEHQGTYQTAYMVNNQAMLARLSINKFGAVLVVTDALEQSSSVNATITHDMEQLDFAGVSECIDVADRFECTLEGQTITLNKTVPMAGTSLEELAGEYQLLNDYGVATIVVADSGKFSTNINGCELKGRLSIDADALVIKKLKDSCDKKVEFGVAFNSTENSAPESLEVFVSDHVLTGDWVKR
ncbi:hypothetical protein HF888_02190 [Bermanella marisrubri]|uniref:Uncharacterized protein n=1 Tax=Bermanella marisrubri TaxID=207949 RepID=Q1N3U0_9GAMM|nr:hypothetical protein [Bermanella marisrubri]EAT12784.1 hypothetical protein RED65_11964 [Oceanobacter sp. RED65] [Bermanella marisrubri]QIZ83110.1 hypothetical protein HF888_02190 [Bermanella marisrubri]